MTSGRLAFIVAGLGLVVLSACAKRVERAVPAHPVPLLGTPGGATTSRADLEKTVMAMETRLASRPADVTAAVTLADALLRQTRVTGNAGMAVRAQRALEMALAADPQHYDARRMLAATFLSQHRFSDALAQAGICRDVRKDDAWVFGIIGDAHLELGDYDSAFDAFDRMAALKPNAASYARAAYARELQGDLDTALGFMRMAAEATGPHDPESLAWHYAQLGHLYLEAGRLADARREYLRADHAFPGHPFAGEGLARVAAAQGDYTAALDRISERLTTGPSPSDLAFAGDVLLAMGRRDDAEQKYRLAESAWRSDAPEPARLARFLAERGRHLDDAVRLAEQARRDRGDIFTDDALAWAYFRSDQIASARVAISRALRTGSRDRTIRYHAAAIAAASGDRERARTLVADALTGFPSFDLVAAPAARALRASLRAGS